MARPPSPPRPTAQAATPATATPSKDGKRAEAEAEAEAPPSSRKKLLAGHLRAAMARELAATKARLEQLEEATGLAAGDKVAVDTQRSLDHFKTLYAHAVQEIARRRKSEESIRKALTKVEKQLEAKNRQFSELEEMAEKVFVSLTTGTFKK